MESLAILIVIILLVIAALLMIPLVIIWRHILKTKFPHLSKWLWLLWAPGLLVAAYFCAVLVIKILSLLTQ